MQLAACLVDGAPLKVVERRRRADGGPLLSCPTCQQQFTVSDRGVVVAAPR